MAEQQTLELLRQNAFLKRINGIAGGHRIAWTARDIGRIHERIASTPLEALVRDVPAASRKLLDAGAAAARRKFSEQGIVIRAATKPGDLNFLFIISSEITDLAGDVVTVDGIDCANFLKNPAVLNAHDSSTLPIAASSSPVVSGKTMTAIARFPEIGVSSAADQVAAAIRGKLVRGASIGFIPVRWSFTKDAARPFGVDFHEIRLLEWSVCGIPCNPACLLLGAVEGQSSRSSSRNQPLADGPDEESDWQCNGVDTMPINETDDAFDAAAAKPVLLERCSTKGTILDEASNYFLATDVSTPWAAKSYLFPFCSVTDAGIVASKIGWRQSLSALEKSELPAIVISDARALCERLEARLGDVKMAERRREARALAARARSISVSMTDDPAPTREQRLAEAQIFRRVAHGGK
jgi:hypothetical protein